MELSRQFRRRMARLEKKHVKKYGSARSCPFDGFPCERSPSPIDGDPQCGGISSFDSSAKNGEEEVILQPCYRSPLSEEGEG